MSGGAVSELGGRRVMPDYPLLQNVNPLRCFECQRHVLFDEQNRDTVAMQHVDDFADLRNHPWHQPLRRLVQ